MKKTFDGLDLLRFLLAVYLTLYHTVYVTRYGAALPYRAWLGLGGFATSSFFLLSGFILAHVYLGQQPSVLRGGAKRFFVNRLTNLYPVHWISLALFLTVGVAGVNPLNRFSLMTLDRQAGGFEYLDSMTTLAIIVATVWMLQAWQPLYEAINPPSWSLSALLFFYACFPWLAPRLLSLRRPGRAWAMLWLGYLTLPVVFAMQHWYAPVSVGFLYTNPLVRLPEFAAGILLYGLYRERSVDWLCATPARRAATLAFVALSFIGGVKALEHGGFGWQYIVHNGALLPSQAALILVCAHVTMPAAAARLATRLGNAALSLFAIHLPLFLIFTKLGKLLAIGMDPLQCVQQFTACVKASRDVVPSMALYPAYLVGTVVAAVVFQERIVVPLRNALRNRLSRGPLQHHTAGPSGGQAG
jgi:peptidoglycan/LPS O-acetylase OafA/YrhL